MHQLSSFNVRCFHHMFIDSVTPASKSAFIFEETILLIWLILRTSMTIYAIWIFAIELVVTGCHPSNFFQDVLLVWLQGISVRMATIAVARVPALEVKDIAKLHLLDTLQFLIWD